MFVVLIGIFVMLITIPKTFATSAQVPHIERQTCSDFYEPSGITQLFDGRILVVEDEKNNPVHLLSLKKDVIVSVQPLKMFTLWSVFSGRPNLGNLSDLEAVALDKDDFVYVITSHSLTQDLKRSTAREKLVRFKIDGNQATNVSVISDLKTTIVQLDKRLKMASEALDVKGSNGFNIEGLSFDKNKQSLFIGLRSPVIDNKAVLLVLQNPKAVFEQGVRPQFKNKPIYLDLDKGGIRSITFDSTLNGYLILSRHEKKGKKFKLWWWGGQENQHPRRVRIDGKLDLSNAEGITSVQSRGKQKLMIVFDVGHQSKRKNGCHVFIDYSQLNIDGFR
ncbi:MAG: DUF3616 domain-containing protein [Thiomicrorhabdus sp.]|nr:DUF3616 domain-containing protein [Thiomicrorhabdus sp.]